jgi:hypothetical protein
MSIYASQTSVSVEKSRAEIESTLARYGAERFAYATEPGRAMIGFCITDPTTRTMLNVRMILPLPAKSEKRFTHRTVYQKWVENPPEMVNKLWEQACRSTWRALALVIKAKLEACASRISTVEREFLADVLLPSGQTTGEWLRPQLKEISERGEMPRLLLTSAS